MVKTLASLPRARALVTTLGARGSVMIRRVDDWGGGAGEKEREGDAPKTTTLKELLAALESGASEDPIARRSSSRMTRVLSFRARARNLTSRHAGNSIPFHSIPSTDIAPAYLTRRASRLSPSLDIPIPSIRRQERHPEPETDAGAVAAADLQGGVLDRRRVRLLPIRPRSRVDRRSLRTFPVVTLHPRFPFNV